MSKEWLNDLAAYKPLLTALALPPVPLLVLILGGLGLMQARRWWGRLCAGLGLVGLWLCACQGTAVWLQDQWLRPDPPMSDARRAELAAVMRTNASLQENAPAATDQPVAIMVLGGGRDAFDRAYGMPDLVPHSAERLRYGIWLSRQTGVPLGFSGGVGWAQKASGDSATEADVAARMAREMYGWPLRWVESESADTRQNANLTVAMLSKQGVREVIVVTEAFHIGRARRVFEEAARRQAALHPGATVMKVSTAPMGYWSRGERALLAWLPSAHGMANVNIALRECLGRLVGA